MRSAPTGAGQGKPIRFADPLIKINVRCRQFALLFGRTQQSMHRDAGKNCPQFRSANHRGGLGRDTATAAPHSVAAQSFKLVVNHKTGVVTFRQNCWEKRSP